MTIETWLILAVVSAIAGGIQSFVYKVAAKEKIDIVLLSFCSSIIASLLLLVLVASFSDFSGFWHPMLIFAGLTAITYLITHVTKVKSLENVDSSVFFPIYKVFGPALVIILGIVFFSEEFSTREWVGLMISLTIPLLLITRVEDSRQINLKKGMVWLAITAIVAAVSAVFWKMGADISPNTWMYILCSELFMVPVAFSVLYKKQQNGFLNKFSALKEKKFLKALAAYSIFTTIGGIVFVFALTTGGPLGIVYTINSLYILIPIVLSIIFYHEHWNFRKAVAIVLSIVAIGFFG